jgi:hypothetical protein
MDVHDTIIYPHRRGEHEKPAKLDAKSADWSKDRLHRPVGAAARVRRYGSSEKCLILRVGNSR